MSLVTSQRSSGLSKVLQTVCLLNNSLLSWCLIEAPSSRMEQLAHLLQNHFQVLEERPICLEIAGMPSAEPFTRPICLQIAGTPSAQPTSGGRTPYLPPDSSGMETLTLLSDIASAYCLGSSRCSATTGWIFELRHRIWRVNMHTVASKKLACISWLSHQKLGQYFSTEPTAALSISTLFFHKLQAVRHAQQRNEFDPDELHSGI